MLNVAIDRSRRCKQAQLVAAFGEQPVDQRLIDAIRLTQRVEDALRGFLVEVEAGGAKGQIEIGDHGIGREIP